MTPTEELAGLLRLAAEKESEKFSYGTDGEHEIVMFKRPDVNMAIYLAGLDDPSYLSLDDCDAIAEACGTWFMVWCAKQSGTWYGRTGYMNHREVVSEFGHDSKRTASLAALCAILRHKYGEVA